jgi:hypothetical protein
MTMTNKKRAPGGGRKPKGPIGSNGAWLQARITDELRANLEQAAAASGRSLSQEAQVRLKESFDLPAELQRHWGTAEVRALAQLVSRVVSSTHSAVGATPFQEAGDLAWHRNPFTHAAASAAIATILARYKPEGLIEVPPKVEERAGWVPAEQAEAVTSPEGVGQASALGLLHHMTIMEPPPGKISAGAHYGESHYVLPRIREILGKPKK